MLPVEVQRSGNRVMGGSFACPECGCEVWPAGLSPGRQTRCDWCKSWVEVPYIPRTGPLRRSRHPRGGSWCPRWAKLTVSALVVAIAVAGVSRVVRARWRFTRTEELAKLLANSQQAETAGRLDEAAMLMESALGVAGSAVLPPSERDALRSRRDLLCRRDVEAQLARLESESGADPDRAVGRALTLQVRAREDDALSGLKPRIATVLDHLRTEWAESDSSRARLAEEDGRLSEALDLCRHQYRTAGKLPTPPRDRLRDDATSRARRLIGRYGVVIDPVRGHFTFGSPEAYSSAVLPEVLSALLRSGYLPRDSESPWEDLWETVAPYRLSIDVREQCESGYLGTPNRLSRVEADVRFYTEPEQPLWRLTPSGRTAVPIPGLAAYQASRLGSADRRTPDAERLLYDKARDALIGRLRDALRKASLPHSQSPEPGTPVPHG